MAINSYGTKGRFATVKGKASQTTDNKAWNATRGMKMYDRQAHQEAVWKKNDRKMSNQSIKFQRIRNPMTEKEQKAVVSAYRQSLKNRKKTK